MKTENRFVYIFSVPFIEHRRSYSTPSRLESITINFKLINYTVNLYYYNLFKMQKTLSLKGLQGRNNFLIHLQIFSYFYCLTNCPYVDGNFYQHNKFQLSDCDLIFSIPHHVLEQEFLSSLSFDLFLLNFWLSGPKVDQNDDEIFMSDV